MKIFAAILTSVGLLLAGAAATAQPTKPTIVLVHGAFADSSSWYGVIAILERDGYRVIAAANPLRSVKGDADTVRALVATLNTPVVLVGHSYGGMVISSAANGQANVKALVYVALCSAGKIPRCVRTGRAGGRREIGGCGAEARHRYRVR
jgi:pimeloyl-ACP methyl ester carboxylesterase